jgi:hypothetical protein
VRAAGPEVEAFDWSTQRCRDDDIPDQPARAYRDAAGQVSLIDTHHKVRRKVGSTLATAGHICDSVMDSHTDPDPSMYNDREWLATTYTLDGTTVYGLIHDEYQGWDKVGYCLRPGEPHADRFKCWYNALTLTTSTNGGRTFSHAPAPGHYVGGPAYRYEAGIGPIGFFQPSNIVRAKDGLYYMLVHVEDHGAQPVGSCLWRTSDLSDRTAWRAWGGGNSFNVRFRDPYVESYAPSEGVCTPVPGIGTLSESLTWNTYLKKWVLVGSADNADGFSGPGFYYFTSDDLLHWSTAKLLMKGELPWTWRCEDGNEQLRDPSLLDDAGESRSFDTTGQRPYLFFTRFNISGCSTSLNRDMIRIPLELSNRQSGGPIAVLEASSTAPSTGDAVRFDASGSSDPGGSVAAYKWDLDGDGVFDRDTGANPVTSKAYSVPGKVTVTLRVCDNAGKATDDTVVLDVSGAPAGTQPAPVQVSEACTQPAGGGGPSGGGGAGTGGGGTTSGGGGTQAAGSPPPASGPGPVAAPAGAPALSQFRLVGKPRSRRDGSLVLRVQAPAEGRLTVRAVGRKAPIRGASANASGPGLLNIRLRLSQAGKALLRKRSRVRVRVRLAFNPVGAAQQKSTRVLMLRRARS